MASSAASLSNPVSAGITLGTAVLKIGLAQLVQHSARLAGARTENEAIAGIVDAYDSDLQTIVQAYNNGQASSALCLQALQTLDARVYNQLRSGTISAGGAPIPGTAWSDSVGMAGLCNKSCTAGCCVYFGDLGPPLSLAALAIGGRPLRAQWGLRDPRYQTTPNGAVIKVPEVFASKYGGQDRPSYTLTIQAPPAPAQVQAGLLSTVQQLLGTGSPVDPGTAAVEAIATPSGAAPGPLGAPGAGVSPELLILGVGFLFVALLVGVFVGKA